MDAHVCAHRHMSAQELGPCGVWASVPLGTHECVCALVHICPWALYECACVCGWVQVCLWPWPQYLCRCNSGDPCTCVCMVSCADVGLVQSMCVREYLVCVHVCRALYTACNQVFRCACELGSWCLCTCLPGGACGASVAGIGMQLSFHLHLARDYKGNQGMCFF